ncbi:glycosyltransferase family 4 protein [Mycobacterium sp. URHB0044]|uniref:glycosyltransferase family 4 protein n=1 Tax=Mycobacterium sp. URHB0044 TaxID=1380386 RepID=UPI000A7998DE|nr:glycosyltransferase family 4 protein [Mycobacterium sp. URHB0044]
MRVLIVGGVFGRDEEYRRSINPTPEMTLEKGLRGRGIEVVVAPHSWNHSLTGIDIVHVHHLAKSVPGLAARRAVRPTPIVFTRHNEERTLPAKRAVALRLINRAADACVALSYQEADRLRSEVRGRVVMIRNGIDAPTDPPPPVLPRQDGPWRLLFAGQLIQRKGLDVLFRAMATIRSQTPVTLRMVYHNSAELENLQDLARQLSIDDIVTFVGKRDTTGMLAEYRLADALVLPSLAEAESLPSVITESLLAHKPVIASADAGIPEQVQNAGVLAPPGDDVALASAIVKLTSDYPGFVSRAQSRAREVRQEYAVETMVDRHLELYESLLQGDRAVTRLARGTGG